jgi:multimeric flavodoxin WrbA
MKVIGLNGSVRKEGNTAIIINAVFGELKNAGIETELVSFSGEILQPCKACFACGGKKNCVHQSDIFGEIFQKVVQANGIILASPSYSADVSVNIKAFIERAAVVADMNLGLLRHKVGAAIAVARRGGALNAIDTMNHFFLNHEMFVAGSTYWNIAYGHMPGDVEKDNEGMETMKNLGINIAYLLNCLNV